MLPREKVDLIKRTVCKEADDNQLALFLHICEGSGLDPFRNQIYAIFFNNDESRAGRGPKDMVTITGIDGLTMMAARDHKDYGGVSSARFTWFEPKKYTPAKPPREIPESATVTVYRKGGEPVEVTCYWEEYAPADLTTAKADFWRRMPKNMLEKCTQSKGLKREFSGQGNIFLIEEMAQKMQDQTPGGRQIVDANGFSPSGQPITYAAQSQSRIAEEVERQKEEHAGNGPKAFAGSITIDYTVDESSPRVFCSSEQVLMAVQAVCTLVWGADEFWHLKTGADLGKIRTVCDKNTFEYIEIVPNKPAPPTNSGSSQRRPENKNTAKAGKKEQGASGRVASPISSRARLISDSYIKSTELKTTPNTKAPYLVMLVKTNNRAVWMSTFDHNFFDWFIKAREHGVDCELYIEDTEKYGPNVVGIKRIGNVEFDGKKPVPKKTEASNAASLFDGAK